MTHYQWHGDQLRIALRVTPKASRDKVGDLHGDQLKVAITAPPVDGKANAHLIRFLAKAFGVSKSCVALISGETNRNKLFAIEAPGRLPSEFQVASRDQP